MRHSHRFGGHSTANELLARVRQRRGGQTLPGRQLVALRCPDGLTFDWLTIANMAHTNWVTRSVSGRGVSFDWWWSGRGDIDGGALALALEAMSTATAVPLGGVQGAATFPDRMNTAP